MNRFTNHLATFGLTALVLALGVGATVSVQAEEPTTSSAQPDQGVQDRAVPRIMNPDAQFEQMQPIEPLQPPTRTQQGFIRQGNNIVAQPGYVLEPGSNNQVTVRMASGGGSAGGQGATSLSCRCTGADGIIPDKTCTTTISGSGANCVVGQGTCDAQCNWTTIITGFSPGGKAMQ